jgi:hypothetical protein
MIHFMSNLDIPAQVSVTFSADYEFSNARLSSLYTKAKQSQWRAEDLDWSTSDIGDPHPRTTDVPVGFPLSRGAWSEFERQYHIWLTSQFLHGEQGALLSAGRLIEVLPTTEGKLLAAMQATDEARHVEVYKRYADSHLPYLYPINGSLATLLQQILSDSRWDITCLGTQIIVEGLALATFRLSRNLQHDPVISQIVDYVARDESRHVSLGILTLGDLYKHMSMSERAEREEFVLEAATLMAARFDLPEVWECLGATVSDGANFLRADPTMMAFRQLTFGRVNSHLARLGLMTPKVRENLIRLGLYRPTLRNDQ